MKTFKTHLVIELQKIVIFSFSPLCLKLQIKITEYIVVLFVSITFITEIKFGIKSNLNFTLKKTFNF